MSDPTPRVSDERRREILAAIAVECPHCHAHPHADCESRNLWTVFPPHKSRFRAATEKKAA